MSNEIKLPKKGGIARARQHMKELLDRKPSEELIRIINENNRIISEQEKEDQDSDNRDRAALPTPRQPEL